MKVVNFYVIITNPPATYIDRLLSFSFDRLPQQPYNFYASKMRQEKLPFYKADDLCMLIVPIFDPHFDIIGNLDECMCI